LVVREEHLDFFSRASRKKEEQGASLASKQACFKRKKEQGGKPCSKNCVDPISPKIWI
jgi:hypothetical protein